MLSSEGSSYSPVDRAIGEIQDNLHHLEEHGYRDAQWGGYPRYELMNFLISLRLFQVITFSLGDGDGDADGDADVDEVVMEVEELERVVRSWEYEEGKFLISYK